MTILLFGIAKDIAGTAELTLENENKTLTNVGALKNYLYDQYPEFSTLSSLAIAVNSTYANDNTAIHQNDEIALIPPVSGG